MIAPLPPENEPRSSGYTENYPELAEPRAQIALNVAVFNPLITGIAMLFLLPLGIQTGQWQYFALSAALGLVFVSSMLSVSWLRKNRTSAAVILLTVAWHITWITLAATVTGLGLVIGGMVLLMTIMIAAETLEARQTSYAIILGVASAIAALAASSYLPENIKISLPGLQASLPYVLIGMLVLYLILIIDRFPRYTLQIKLVTIFFAIVLIPLAGVSYLFNNALRNTVNEDARTLLKMGASQVAYEVDNFIYTTLTTLRTDAAYSSLQEYLRLPPEERLASPLHQDVNLFLKSLESRDSLNIETYALVDSRGVVLLDTQAENQGASESEETYFLETSSLGRAHVTEVQFSKRTGRPLLTFASPVRNPAGTIVGFLRVRYDASILQQMLNRYIAFIGPRSYPILLDDATIRLADASTPANVHKFAANLLPSDVRRLQILGRLQELPEDQLKVTDDSLVQAIETNASFFVDSPQAVTGRINAGALTRLTNVSWVMVFVQDQEVYLAPIEQQLNNLVLIVVLIAALIALVAITTASVLSRPITELTTTALNVAQGDLTARARIHTTDEIGMLGQTFNNMTGQLEQLVTGLEDRVSERTRELEKQSEHMRYRATQLQTVADVASAVASVSDLNSLLSAVTTLIAERFNYYHAGIFLIDEHNEYANLLAANSEGGQRMLARHHRLKVGQVGIVGYTTGYGQARIATDVGADAVFFNNPDLPETRSEMAIPLKIGERIIGALDIQSKETNAFSEDDVSLFTTLADQVAIAIQNNRLFEETRQALKESQEIHRKYLRQEWSQELAERGTQALRFSQNRLEISQALELPEIKEVLRSGTVTTHTAGQDDAAPRSALAVPIILRGEVIGVIDLQEAQPDRKWTEDEIAAVQSVADQVALALENARLFEQTVRRADRDRKVLEITSKIRAANDPQTMLQTALKELQRTLNTTQAQILLQPSGAMRDLPEVTVGPRSEDNLATGNGSNGNGSNGNGSNGHHPDDLLLDLRPAGEG